MRRLRKSLRRHWPRIAVTLVPVAMALAHAAGVWRLPLLDRLDVVVNDMRLRASMPATLDPRVVIVDIDDDSLQEIGQWPWSRDRLAQLSAELILRQRVSVLGFDIVFAEHDRSTQYAATLQAFLEKSSHADSASKAEIRRMAESLDHDAEFARAISGHNVFLGFYFTQTAPPRRHGELPPPLLPPGALSSGGADAVAWNGYGASIAGLAAAAPAGFLNVLVQTEADADGVVRSAPLLARYAPESNVAQGAAGYYESLGLAIYRRASGASVPFPRFAREAPSGIASSPLDALVMARPGGSITVPVDRRASMLVPYRGPGGARGGSFRYVSASDILNGRLSPGELAGKIALVGTTAPGLMDLRATPVSAIYPGVEVHASIISSLLDQRFLWVPDYAPGYDFVQILVLGGILAVGLSLSNAAAAVGLFGLVAALAVGANHLFFLRYGLVFPQAACLLMIGLAFAFNMGWGYFVEARTRRGLARLFGTYVPPQLVNEMLRDPGRYTMRAHSKELTVLFCDMRGFTRLSEQMTPAELQAFLNRRFGRLTEIINRHRGTVDKYMGDCVMAFWGAPLEAQDHANLAVGAAIDMVNAVEDMNARARAAGTPTIEVGIGLNTGTMSVGDMGSKHRRSYTVIGDAVNLASRLEGLGEYYGVQIVASQSTCRQADRFLWQEMDRVRVRGKLQDVAIFTPVNLRTQATAAQHAQTAQWQRVLDAYRARRWHDAEQQLAALRATDEDNVLYHLYAKRLGGVHKQPPSTDWDVAVDFERK